MTAYTLSDKARKLAELDGQPVCIAPDLPKWLWGSARDLLYPNAGMATAKPGQMWLRADPDLTERRIAEGNADDAVRMLRRIAVTLFNHPDAEAPIVFALDADDAGKVVVRRMNR
jgi:hypothetical protein